MKFKMEMSGNNKGYGRLCCTVPDEMESAIIFKDFEAFCRKKAKEKFGDYRAITERLDKELNFIKETDSVIFFEILREIAKFSAGEGYPVSLEGEESGLLILYLLGVSGIHPGEYEFRTTPTDLFIEAAGKRGEVNLSLAIAESIRNLIVPQLTKEFDYIESDENDWFEIDIASWEMLDEIGKLSKLTGVHYSMVPVDDYLLAAVQSWDICETDLEWENTSEDYCESITPLSVAKHYAFARCNCNVEKTRAAFSDMQKYIFRDDLYTALTDAGIPSQKAYLLARNWLKGEDKEKEIEMLREYNLPLNAVYVFKELYNQWSIATCLSRVNALVLLRYYEFNYPKEFEELDYEVNGIIPTGFYELDKILDGGFRRDDLCIITGNDDVTKAFSAQLTQFIAESGRPVKSFHWEKDEIGNAYELRQLANELQVPIICTCQFTEKLDINSFEWSGSLPTVIEQEASIVLKIEKDSETNNAHIIVAKNTYGNTGTTHATFDKERLMFTEKE
jgi:hypothetical protein